MSYEDHCPASLPDQRGNRRGNRRGCGCWQSLLESLAPLSLSLSVSTGLCACCCDVQKACCRLSPSIVRGRVRIVVQAEICGMFFSHDSAPAHQITLPTGLSFKWSEACPETRQPMQPYGDWRANSEVDRQPMQPLAKHALALSTRRSSNLRTNLRSTSLRTTSWTAQSAGPGAAGSDAQSHHRQLPSCSMDDTCCARTIAPARPCRT